MSFILRTLIELLDRLMNFNNIENNIVNHKSEIRKIRGDKLVINFLVILCGSALRLN